MTTKLSNAHNPFYLWGGKRKAKLSPKGFLAQQILWSLAEPMWVSHCAALTQIPSKSTLGTLLASKIRGEMSPYKHLGYSQHQRDQENISENHFLQTQTIFLFFLSFFGQNWTLFPICTEFKSSHLNKNCLLPLSAHLGKHSKLGNRPLYVYHIFTLPLLCIPPIHWNNGSFWVEKKKTIVLKLFFKLFDPFLLNERNSSLFFQPSILSNLSRHHLTETLCAWAELFTSYRLQITNSGECSFGPSTACWGGVCRSSSRALVNIAPLWEPQHREPRDARNETQTDLSASK